MNPVDLDQLWDMAGRPIRIAEHQEQYETLPAKVDGDVVQTRWELTDEERRAIANGARIELFVWNFGMALQPVALPVQGVREEAPPDDAK